MERIKMEELVRWKEKPGRKPLILKGARQVGKTWLMKEFGERYFDQTAYVNLDRNSRMRRVFDGDFDVEAILMALNIETGVAIQPERTLIMAAVEAVTAVLACLYARRQLGGMSGDIAGYTICISELAGILVLAIW